MQLELESVPPKLKCWRANLQICMLAVSGGSVSGKGLGVEVWKEAPRWHQQNKRDPILMMLWLPCYTVSCLM